MSSNPLTNAAARQGATVPPSLVGVPEFTPAPTAPTTDPSRAQLEARVRELEAERDGNRELVASIENIKMQRNVALGAVVVLGFLWWRSR